MYNYWEVMAARDHDTNELKNWLWMATNGQPIPGNIGKDAIRYVLIERGEDGKGYHNS